MDLSNIIIGIVALALFVVPIMYIKSIQKKKAARHLQEFLDLGKAQQLTLTRHEFWDDNYGIGLDEGQQKLFYVNKFAGREQQLVVPLANMKQCTVSTTNREANGSKIMEQIGLRFVSRNPKDREMYLEFYNREVNLMLSEELQIANRWSALANESIKSASASNLSPTTVHSA
jgi:hypothetical protein